MDNPTVTWRSRDSRINVISVLELRKFVDSRGGFPDTNRGGCDAISLQSTVYLPASLVT